MPKLKLNVADLQVQPFATGRSEGVTAANRHLATPTCGYVSCNAACWTEDPIHNPYC